MAIKSTLITENGIPVQYWRFSRLSSMDLNKKEAVITIEGYFTKDAKEKGLKPLLEKEFMVTNQKEKEQKVRPATLDEKKELISYLKEEEYAGVTDEMIEAIPYDIVIDEGEKIYPWFDTFFELTKTKDLQVAAYDYLGKHPAPVNFLTDAEIC